MKSWVAALFMASCSSGNTPQPDADDLPACTDLPCAPVSQLPSCVELTCGQGEDRHCECRSLCGYSVRSCFVTPDSEAIRCKDTCDIHRCDPTREICTVRE